ncbi:MAG TPA: indole-3-glycerol-phosphate synthase [Acidimicrobiales bacterium]|nr:indole-3-glycerol-phosphate synthase [Acidimicrobiales bacterium]
MATYLEAIVAAHRAMARDDRRDLDHLTAAALAAAAPWPFADALAAAASSGLAVIAEVKRRSPSRPDLAPGLDPGEVAAAYAAGGATCLSVLTDAEFFGGSADDLAAARRASGRPTLRKDFTVGPADVCDARLMGADAVLLIVAALDDAELSGLLAFTGRLGLDALVEVHDDAELDRALGAGATLVGVNQRDLATFAVDPDRAERLAGSIPAHVVSVAESGVGDAADAARLAAAGYQAVLVGEAVVTASDRAAAVAALAGHPVGPRAARRPVASP